MGRPFTLPSPLPRLDRPIGRQFFHVTERSFIEDSRLRTNFTTEGQTIV